METRLAPAFTIHVEMLLTGMPDFETTAPYAGKGIATSGWSDATPTPGDKSVTLYQGQMGISEGSDAPLPNKTTYQNFVKSRVDGGASYTGQIWLDIEKAWQNDSDSVQVNKHRTMIQWTQEAVPNAKVGHYAKVPSGGHPTGLPNPPFTQSDQRKPIFDQANLIRGGGYTSWVEGRFDNWTRRNRAREAARVAPGKPTWHFLKPTYENPSGTSYSGLVEEEVFLQQLHTAKNLGADGVVIWQGPSNPPKTWSTAENEPWWKAVRKFVGIDANGREIEVRKDSATGPILSDGTSTVDFGSVAAAGTASVTKTFHVKNTGTGILTLGLIDIAGSHPGDFKKIGGDVRTTVAREPYVSITHGPTGKDMERLSLFGGQSTTFQITFEPKATGTRTATLSFQNNDTNENPFNFTIKGTGTASLLADGPAVAGSSAASLDQAALAPLVAEARARWVAAGADLRALAQLRFVVADLDGNTLGLQAGTTIYLDHNAAGYGWFLDPTPWDDSEFADGSGPAGMDLLSVLAHEMGHALGLDHADDGVMEETLSVGERDAPAAVALGSRDLVFSLLGLDEELWSSPRKRQTSWR